MLIVSLIFLLVIGECYATKIEKIPIFSGNELLGFIKVKNNNESLSVDFEIKQNDLKFIILNGAVPFSSEIGYCEKFLKTATKIKLESALTKFDISKTDLIGNTIVLIQNGKTMACATIILEATQLFEIVLSNEKINGRIYSINIDDEIIKVLPLISLSPETEHKEKSEFNFGLVKDCSDEIEENNSSSSSSISLNSMMTKTIKIDNNSSSTEFLNNLQETYLKLFDGEKVILCEKFSPSNILSAKAGNIIVEQKNAFVSPRLKNFSDKNQQQQEFMIGETCDKSTDKVLISNGFVPNLNLFGSDSKLFKTIKSDENQCEKLLPKFGSPILSASLLHPIIGKIHLIKTDAKYFIVSDLRSIFDENETPGTIRFSNKPTMSSSCFNFSSTFEVKEPTPVRGSSNKESKNIIQEFPRLIDFNSIKSVQIDLGWIKACANLTLLSLGVIKGNAILRTHNIAASRRFADINIFEYPLLNETEIMISKNSKNIHNFHFYKRPIDMTLSTAPPCSESTIGAKITNNKIPWENELIKKLTAPRKGSNNKKNSDDDENAGLMVKGKILTGDHSILGLTIMAEFDDNAVGCGAIELEGKKKIIAMAIFNESISGFIKLTQISSSLALPTEVSYYLQDTEFEKTLLLQRNNQEISSQLPKLYWEIVTMNNDKSICSLARPYDPFKISDHNKCGEEDIDFCPIGSVVNRSSEFLTLNSKQHFILHGSSIVVDGAAAASNNNLYARIHSPQNNQTTTTTTTTPMFFCSKINLYEIIFIHWLAESNTTLSFLQTHMSQRLLLSPYQIGVDYTREFKEGKCSIFSIMLLLTSEQKEAFNKKFDISKQKFFDDELINCSSSEEENKNYTSSSSNSASHKLSYTIFLNHIFSFIFCIIFAMSVVL